MTIELRLLGPVQVLIDGRSITDELDRKEIALLAYLSMQQVEVSRERAADLLWGNLDLIDVKPRPNVGHALSPLSTDARPADSKAKHNLRHALYNLNRVMPKGEVVPVPILCSVTFGAPIRLEEGEERRAFLDRARLAVMAVRDV